jgi:hypothetical protein
MDLKHIFYPHGDHVRRSRSSSPGGVPAFRRATRGHPAAQRGHEGHASTIPSAPTSQDLALAPGWIRGAHQRRRAIMMGLPWG